jgi:hypothetical protein
VIDYSNRSPAAALIYAVHCIARGYIRTDLIIFAEYYLPYKALIDVRVECGPGNELHEYECAARYHHVIS